MPRKIRIGSRGSQLALTQAYLVKNELERHIPDCEFEIKIIKTSGDRGDYVVGAFVKELEIALLRKEIELAVHSLKDLPYKLSDGLEISAVPIRDDPTEALISRNDENFFELKRNAKVGTSSLRRKIFLKSLRDDLNIIDIRGNVNTRIRKVKTGEFDAIVVALAGVKRLGLIHKVSQVFGINEILPPPGQGAIAVETRIDSEVRELVSLIDDKNLRIEVETEREFLGEMNVGCKYPIGAFAQISGGSISLKGCISFDNLTILKSEMTDSIENYKVLAKKLADKLKNENPNSKI